MWKRTKVKTNKRMILQGGISAAGLITYVLLLLFIPSRPRILCVIYTALFLVAAAVYDIRTRQIPIGICLMTGFTGILYSFFSMWNIINIITCVVILTVFFIIHLLSRKTIGSGDLLLLGFPILSLFFEDILLYLFLTFFFSGILGLVDVIKGHKMKDIAIPLAPCITFAFIIASF